MNDLSLLKPEKKNVSFGVSKLSHKKKKKTEEVKTWKGQVLDKIINYRVAATSLLLLIVKYSDGVSQTECNSSLPTTN